MMKINHQLKAVILMSLLLLFMVIFALFADTASSGERLSPTNPRMIGMQFAIILVLSLVLAMTFHPKYKWRRVSVTKRAIKTFEHVEKDVEKELKVIEKKLKKLFK